MREEARSARKAVVRQHFESEAAGDFDTTMATFENPRYEIVPTGQVFTGLDEVLSAYRTIRAAFPDQRHENIRLHHTDSAVIAEFDLLGTHRGAIFGVPATGHCFRCPVVTFFFFAGETGTKIVCERVYLDQMTIMTQLGLAPAPARP